MANSDQLYCLTSFHVKYKNSRKRVGKLPALVALVCVNFTPLFGGKINPFNINFFLIPRVFIPSHDCDSI